MNHTGNGGFRSAVAAAEAALLLVPLLPPRALVGADRLVVAGHPDQLVALLVDEQLALRALEALPAQAPDPVTAERAEGPLRFEKERGRRVNMNTLLIILHRCSFDFCQTGKLCGSVLTSFWRRRPDLD